MVSGFRVAWLLVLPPLCAQQPAAESASPFVSTPPSRPTPSVSVPSCRPSKPKISRDAPGLTETCAANYPGLHLGRLARAPTGRAWPGSTPPRPDRVLTRRLFARGGPLTVQWGVESLVWVIDPDGGKSYPFHTWSLGRILSEVETAARGR